jgi:hypothetical protein
MSYTNKAVVAYVMLRSMEGRDRVIQAYKGGSFKRWCMINCCCQGEKYKKNVSNNGLK